MFDKVSAWMTGPEAQVELSADTLLPLPRRAISFSFEHLTSHELRSLGCLNSVQLTSSFHRKSLLALANDKAEANNRISWEAHNAKVRDSGQPEAMCIFLNFILGPWRGKLLNDCTAGCVS